MKQSSSIHNLNADKGLTKYQKLLYLLLNWVNNSLFVRDVDRELNNIRDFKTEICEEDWSQLDIKSSPSRKLSDLFWLKLPWEQIKSELGQINILDTGCGSGNHGVKIQSFSKNTLSSYKGIDLTYNNNWNVLEKQYKNFSFEAINSANILNSIPEGTNFIISQSAIEHFDEDLSYFGQVHDFILRKSKNIIQIHLFPSSACLKLYLFHGVRQYTPRTISKITRMFGNFSYSTLYQLGGEKCNKLHYEFITKPYIIKSAADMRDTKTLEYDRKLFNAIKADMQKLQKSPNFYALIIHSNWRKKIFL